MVGSSLPEGYVLAEKYRLIALIGHGGMGEVWRAEHLALKSAVAIKVIHTDRAMQEDVLSRFMREAQAAYKLRGAHVVQILDFGVENGAPYMVMELLEGESLAKRISQAGRLPPPETALIISHIARAVGKAHEAGIVHRDLKPENVFLTYGEGELVSKVLDFGIAKFQHPSNDIREASTRTGAILGTPFYMSPEQAEGTRNIDYRADIWSMGVIAFECLTGQRPFDGEALGEVLLKICARAMPVPSQLAAVPAGFDAWFAKAASRDLSARFQSAREAADALAKLCAGTAATTALPMVPDIVQQLALTPEPGALVQTGDPLVQTGDPRMQTGDPVPHALAQSGGHLGQTGGPLARTVNPRNGPPAALIAAVILIGAVLVIGLPLGAWAAFKHRSTAHAQGSAASEANGSFGTQEIPSATPPAESPAETAAVAPPESPAPVESAVTPPVASEKTATSAHKNTPAKPKPGPTPAKPTGTPGSTRPSDATGVY